MIQAQKFGAEIRTAYPVMSLKCGRRPYAIEFANGHAARARSAVIATGAEYRQLSLDNASRFLGTGIYYAATSTEARRCGTGEAIVVGGGNSAGQAAVFLAGSCKMVHLLVRSSGLADTMSQYLIRPQGFCTNRLGFAGRGFIGGEMADCAQAGIFRIQRPRSICSGRRALRQREARRGGGRRGVGLHSAGASSAA